MRHMGIVITLASTSGLGTAGDVFGVDGAEFFRVDPNDPGGAAVVGSLGLAPTDTAFELAYSPDDGRLYTIVQRGLGGSVLGYELGWIDTGTGACTIIGPLFTNAELGYIESLEWVASIGELLLVHSDGGTADFGSDVFRSVDRVTGATAQLFQIPGLDADSSGYDSNRDAYYTLDPNGAGWALIDAGSGSSSFAGTSRPTVGDLAFDPDGDRFLGIDFDSGELLRFTPGPGPIGAAVSLGTLGVTGATGIAWVPGCAADLAEPVGELDFFDVLA